MAFRIGMVLAAALVAAQAMAQEGSPCRIGGGDGPCRIEGGVYRALLPEGQGPFPALVWLYGSGGRSRMVTDADLFRRAVVARGWALIVPAAGDLDYAGGTDTGWSLRHSRRGEGRDDAGFVARVLEDAARRLPVDRRRMVLAGQSRGGFLIWEIACHTPRMAAAYAVHAAGYLGPMPEACGGELRFLHGHGLQDRIVPLSGRGVVERGVPMVPVAESLARLARTSACPGPPREETQGPWSIRSWSGCLPGAAIELRLHPGGHGWPARWLGDVIDWAERLVPDPARIRQGGAIRFRPVVSPDPGSRFLRPGG